MTIHSGSEEILATVQASPLRRAMGVSMLGGLGLLTLYLGLTTSPDMSWRLFLLAVAAVSLWASRRMWLATAHRVELTTEVLRCSDGTIIARVEDLQKVDRGAFAFKPSNGFLLRSAQPGARIWNPGLWWRMGRRIGVGGVTPGSETKTMSEIIAAMIAQRTLSE